MDPMAKYATALNVLLVEDSPGDARLTREAFRETNRAVDLHVVADGVEAMAFLRREGVHTSAPRPDLVLLDLTLPKLSGHQVLARIKANHELRSIPTVILSTSIIEQDVATSYELQASCHLGKPVDLEDFETLVKSINDFWLGKPELPLTA
jgi:CheY-like chemotaxis protein